MSRADNELFGYFHLTHHLLLKIHQIARFNGMEIKNMKKNRFSTTCFDLLQKEVCEVKLVTGFKKLDEQLKGGIALRSITEFSGAPGTGKTQMCLQLCLNVQIAQASGGLGGMAIYIDTRQHYNPQRLQELAQHMTKRYAQHSSDGIVRKEVNLLESVYNVSCPEFAQLVATVKMLPQYLQKQPLLKLVVIDSLSFPLRMIEDVSERTTLLYELMYDLRQIRQNFDVAIVTTNEITNRLIGQGRYKLVSALGDTHAYTVNKRVIFARSHNGKLTAALGKTRQTSRFLGHFEIKANGLRGID